MKVSEWAFIPFLTIRLSFVRWNVGLEGSLNINHDTLKGFVHKMSRLFWTIRALCGDNVGLVGARIYIMVYRNLKVVVCRMLRLFWLFWTLRALCSDNDGLVWEMIWSEQIEELQIQIWRRDFFRMTLATNKTISAGFVMLVWWEVGSILWTRNFINTCWKG